MSRSTPIPRERRGRWTTKRSLVAHAVLLIWLPGCSVATWWQIGVAESGDSLGWVYAVMWPAFAVFGIVFWWFLIHDDPDTLGRRALRQVQAERPTIGRDEALARRRGRGPRARRLQRIPGIAGTSGSKNVPPTQRLSRIPRRDGPGRDHRGMPAHGRALWHLHPGVRSGEALSPGERAADRMRNMMGSWPFVFSFFAVMIAWAVLNTLLLQRVVHHKAFDPYPYILLNLFLSMLAGVQAAALLIAAKRSDAISSEIALHTEKNTDDIKTLIRENTELTAQVKRATDLLDEIHLHVANIGRKVGAEMGRFPPDGPRGERSG